MNYIQQCARRSEKRTLEEVFYIVYIIYSVYVNPKSKHRCEIEEAIKYLIEQRKFYIEKRNLKNG